MGPCGCSAHGYAHHHAFGRAFVCTDDNGPCAYCRLAGRTVEGQVEDLIDADVDWDGRVLG